MRLHLNEGCFEGKRILPAGIVREMQAMQISIPISKDRKKMLGTRFLGYGLGWGLSDYRGNKLVTHGGGLSGMISYQALVPERKLGVIVLTNFAPNDLAKALAYRIIDACLGEANRDWSAEFKKADQRDKQRREAREMELEGKRIPHTRPTLDPSGYAGGYANDLSGEARVVLEEGRLVFRYNPRYIGDLEHWHYDTFRLAWRHPIFDMAGKTFVTFILNAEGEAEELITTFYDPIRFKRISDP
jgi:hypothetical protein